MSPADVSSCAVSHPSTCCASSRASRLAAMAMPAARSRSVAAAMYSRRGLGDSGRVFQLFRLIEHADVVEQLDDVAVQDAFELVRREVDAVVRDAALRKVVGADFLRSLAGADLAAAILGDRFVLLVQD